MAKSEREKEVLSGKVGHTPGLICDLGTLTIECQTTENFNRCIASEELLEACRWFIDNSKVPSDKKTVNKCNEYRELVDRLEGL